MPTDTILLAHGSGGRMTHDLIGEVFLRHLGNPLLATQDEQPSGPSPTRVRSGLP